MVVNADSPLSLRVANEYMRLRQIPEAQTLWLSGVPSLKVIDVATFRERVWAPIQEYLARQGLDAAVDAIAFSADLPYAVRFAADLKAHQLAKDRRRGDVASLTGLTFFARRVVAGDLGYLGRSRYFRANLVYRGMPGREATAVDRERYADAHGALEKKDYARAAEGYQRLLAEYPWVSGAWYDLARSRAALGDPEGAVQALHGAVEQGWARPLATRTEPLLKPLAGHPAFADLMARMKEAAGTFEPAQGFRSRYAWDGPAGLPVTPPGNPLDRYYLSTLLAYTGVRGSSLPEVLSYLAAAASSDGSAPDGTVYLMANPDVRAATREGYFEATVAALRQRGRRAEVLERVKAGQDGAVPIGRSDVIGAVIGAATFDWARSGSRLLPGAIAESLTSYGADFGRAKQTKLSALLRHGAAGSSGAVQEPFAIQAKFPVAYMHVHYADGCSLAEAFFQSVEMPYQLLVVGDPLARPYARFASVSLVSPSRDRPWAGVVSLLPRVEAPADVPSGEVELWVDGRPVASARSGEAIAWDTRGVEDGFHDLRLVAVEATRIETRSFGRWEVAVSNHGLSVTAEGPERVRLGEPLVLSGRAEGARQVAVLQGTRQLGRASVVQGGWRLAVPSGPLGAGPVTLHVQASWPEGGIARSRPMALYVDEPVRIAPRGPAQDTGGGLRLQVRYPDGREADYAVSEGKAGAAKLFAGGVRPASARLAGTFKVHVPGLYQLAVQGQGPLRVEVDGVSVARADHGPDREAFVPLALEAGEHALAVEWPSPGVTLPQVVLAGEEPARDLLE